MTDQPHPSPEPTSGVFDAEYVGERQAAESEYQEWLEAKASEDRENTERLEELLVANCQLPSQLSSEPPRWLVEDFILEHGLTMLTGKQGSGKSLLALWVADAVARGTSFAGRKAMRAPFVVYVDKENPEAEVYQRLSRMGLSDLTNLWIWGNWRKTAAPSTFDHPAFLEMAERGRPLFIFDSLMAFEEMRNENNPAEIAPVMEKALRLARRSAGVLILHHAPKTPGGPQYRGTTAIPAACDMAAGMWRNEDGSVTIGEEKFRMCAPWELTVRIEFGDAYRLSPLKDQRRTHVQQVDAQYIEATRLVKEAFSIGCPLTQGQLQEKIGIKSNAVITAFIDRGEGKFWEIQQGPRNSKILVPLS